MILKGHLLLEEMLREILGKSVTSQESVDAAQLTFYQVVCIVQSMYTNKANEWVWSGIVAVNKIRNKMAHNLKPTNIDEKCESLIEHCRRFGIGNVRLCEESGYSELAMAITDLHYALWEILKSVLNNSKKQT